MKRRSPHRQPISRQQEPAHSVHSDVTPADFLWEGQEFAVPQIPPPSTECLTEEQSLAYLLQSLDANTLAVLARHLDHCPICLTEIARLQELAQVWDRGQTAFQLELRMALTSPALLSALSARSTRLEPLIRPTGAFGEDRNTDEVTLPFPVFAIDGSQTTLQGTLIRQQRDYYVHVHATPAEWNRPPFPRRILLTLVDPLDTQPLLQRQIDIGVTVILGTGLKLTAACFVHASLLSAL